ncbi:hypothetical protein MAHJHV60_47400 [Mycobacterium avium subsp. hominissuis]
MVQVAVGLGGGLGGEGGHLHHYAKNRALLLDGLRGIGITRLAPTDGAFYVYADVSGSTSSPCWRR